MPDFSRSHQSQTSHFQRRSTAFADRLHSHATAPKTVRAQYEAGTETAGYVGPPMGPDARAVGETDSL
jgi:hypothetical protein